MALQLPGYPQPVGAKTQVLVNLAGPAAYVAVVPGSPPAGGQLVNAAEIGLKFIDAAACSMSDDGQFEVLVTRGNSATQAVPSVRLMWRTAATGVEVGPGTNLSARSIRIGGIGIG